MLASRLEKENQRFSLGHVFKKISGGPQDRVCSFLIVELNIQLKITYTEKYPFHPPLISSNSVTQDVLNGIQDELGKSWSSSYITENLLSFVYKTLKHPSKKIELRKVIFSSIMDESHHKHRLAANSQHLTTSQFVLWSSFEANKLTYLSLNDNCLTDLGFLVQLQNLDRLELSNNRISSLEHLKTLINLTFVKLNYNEIKTLSELVTLKKLVTLELSDNLITDASPLAHLSSLEVCHLNDNKITKFDSHPSSLRICYLDATVNPTIVGALKSGKIVTSKQRSFQTSNFNKEYSSLVELDYDGKADVTKEVEFFIDLLPTNQAEKKIFILALASHKSAKADFKQYAVRLWTSSEKIQGKELCSHINMALIQDKPSTIKHVAKICRAINSMLVTRAKPPEAWPKNNKTYRGGALPKSHHEFYKQLGKKYRAPMFLATSFEPSVAEFFAQRAENRGEEPVLWTVHVSKQCQNVNYIETLTAEKSEHEFLFVPYSIFEIVSCNLKKNPTASDPHEIEIKAFDSLETEDQVLAPWC
eukprot:Lithocolla_globosa_v1_NODE_1545_length_2495_cov_33.624180.p1 type:complete len:532 gc:universal NODE_1545_length_2495_cov_33.624180:1755-160(-)